MKTKININGNNCCKIVLEDGTINIDKDKHVFIDGDWKITIDDIPLDEWVKSQKKYNNQKQIKL